MKIVDLKNKLPCRVKITSGFTLEESIDPGFVVDIVRIEEEDRYGEEWCYKIWFNIPPELIPICTKVSRADWLDDNGQHSLNYFEYNFKLNKNGTYQDIAFVMENDDWFEIYNEDVLIKINFATDPEGDTYFIPSELVDDFRDMCKGLDADQDSDEYEKAYHQYSNFRKYQVEGNISDYQLYISLKDLNEITNEQLAE